MNTKLLVIYLFFYFSFTQDILSKQFVNNEETPMLNVSSSIPNCFSVNENFFYLLFDQLGKSTPLEGNINQLKYFFEALKESGKTKVNIAHYGDSIILGDIITEYIRELFQKRFAGQGVGLVSITPPDFGLRSSTNISFSDDWDSAALTTRNPKNLPFGIGGFVASPKIGSWAKFESTKNLNSANSFETIKLYYSHAESNSTIEYKLDNSAPKKIPLEKGDGVSTLNISSKKKFHSFEFKFVSGKSPFFYGVDLTSEKGISVHNFPMPGNSGASLLEISPAMFSSFKKINDYKLFILNYGSNVSLSNPGVLVVYKNKTIKVIETIKKYYPDAGIILISAPDKTQKVGSNYITNPDILKIIEVQKKIVKETNISFWNMYEAMGGNNSMYDWVNSNPQLALKDFSHFNTRGGAKIAGFLFEAIMDAYSKFTN